MSFLLFLKDFAYLLQLHRNHHRHYLSNYNDFQIDYPVNPKKALEGYTILKGYEYVEKEDFSMAKMPYILR